MNILKYALLLALPFSMVTASQNVDPILSTYQVYNVDETSMNRIAEKFEVVRKLPNGFEVIVPEKDSAELKALAPNNKLIEIDNSASLRNSNFWSPRKFDGMDGYHKFSQVVEKFQKLAETHSDFVQFVEYGKSADGLPLFAVKLSDNVSTDEDEPELMITAATHGDEIITTEIVINLINKLVDGYNVDPRLSKMINDHEIYFIPVVNADGYVNRARYDKGRDPNRSYPYPELANAAPTASINALIAFFKSRNFVGSLDFHAYGELTMYPWAYTSKPVPKKDAEAFDALAKKMAATNGYTYGPISKVIYVAKGSSADYYYWTKKTLAMAVEVGSDKAPYPNEIPEYTKQQTESTWLFIENF